MEVVAMEILLPFPLYIHCLLLVSPLSFLSAVGAGDAHFSTRSLYGLDLIRASPSIRSIVSWLCL